MTRLRAVLFDLDDTLYPQSAWLHGAWRAVAAHASTLGIEPLGFEQALQTIAARGSDEGRIIDRALTLIGRDDVDTRALVATFLDHRPDRLVPYAGVVDGLARLAQLVPLGLVTDGSVATQRAKLAALDLESYFRVVVYSDDLGRERRKPDALPFVTALDRLGRVGADVVHVGDRPAKDGVGAEAAGIRFVRVRTGEYSDTPDTANTWASVDDVRRAIELLIGVASDGVVASDAERT